MKCLRLFLSFALLLFSLHSTAYSNPYFSSRHGFIYIHSKKSQVNLQPNKSSQFLTIDLSQSKSQYYNQSHRATITPKFTSIHPNLESLKAGSYQFSFDIKASKPFDQLAVIFTNRSKKIQSNIRPLKSNNIEPDIWYNVSVPFHVYWGTWTGNISLRVEDNINNKIPLSQIDLDNISIRQTKTYSKSDPANFHITHTFEKDPLLQAPKNDNITITSSLNVPRIGHVRQNLAWQNVPDWFSKHRVHIHTITPRQQLNQDPVKFWNIAKELKDIGTTVFTRHVKSRHEGPWWPTQYPSADNSWSLDPTLFGLADDFDITQTIIDKAHQEDTKIITYYWINSENKVADHYPEWLAQEPIDDLSSDQELNDSNNFQKVKITENSTATFLSNCVDEQIEFTNARLLELMMRESDGVYFDFKLGAPDGDWNAEIQDKATFKMPLNKKLINTNYRKLLSLYDQCNTNNFIKYQNSIHAINSDAAAIISASFMANLWDPRNSTSNIEQLQSPKYEWHHPIRSLRKYYKRYNVPVENRPSTSLYMGLIYSLMRDAAHGRPGHVWVFNPAGKDLNKKEIPLTEQHLLTSSAAIMAYGAISNLHIEKQNPALFESSIRMGDGVGEYLSQTKPEKWFGIHFSEAAREITFAKSMTTQNAFKRIWENIILPMIYAFETAQKLGLPVTFITDKDLLQKDLSQHDVIFVPSTDFHKKYQKALNEFDALPAKHVIYHDKIFHSLSQPKTSDNLKNNLEATLDLLLDKNPPHIQVLNDIQHPLHYGIYYSNTTKITESVQEKVIVVANDFEWLVKDCRSLPSSEQIDCLNTKSQYQPDPAAVEILYHPDPMIDPITDQNIDVMIDGEVLDIVAKSKYLSIQPFGKKVKIKLSSFPNIAVIRIKE